MVNVPFASDHVKLSPQVPEAVAEGLLGVEGVFGVDGVLGVEGVLGVAGVLGVEGVLGAEAPLPVAVAVTPLASNV